MGVKRRALLSTVAAGGLAGCVSVRTPPTVVGLDQTVEMSRCGKSIGRPCDSVRGIDRFIDRPIQIREAVGGGVAVYRTDDSLVVRGFVTGVEDVECRAAHVSRIELRGQTLAVVVRDGASVFPVLCEESAGAVQYRISVDTNSSDRIDTVRVEHRSDKRGVILSGAVGVPAA